MNTQSVDQIQQLIEDADADSLYGIEWNVGADQYLQVYASAGWEEGLAGVTVDGGAIWISGDAVAESAQSKRVEALIEAGYSTELAQSQKFGYDDDAARAILDDTYRCAHCGSNQEWAGHAADCPNRIAVERS